VPAAETTHIVDLEIGLPGIGVAAEHLPGMVKFEAERPAPPGTVAPVQVGCREFVRTRLAGAEVAGEIEGGLIEGPRTRASPGPRHHSRLEPVLDGFRQVHGISSPDSVRPDRNTAADPRPAPA